MRETNESVDGGYEVSSRRLRAWLGPVELRLDNQWAELLQPAPRGAIVIDLPKLCCAYRTGGTRGRERVRRAAAEAAAVAGRLARGSS